MKLTLLCMTSLVLALVMAVSGQNQPLTTPTGINTPLNPTWTGNTAWNANPSLTGNTAWNGNPTWTGNTAWNGSPTWGGNPAWGGNTQIWNGDQSFGRPFYNPSYRHHLQGQTVYCYPLNPTMYQSFLPVSDGPIEEIGTVIGGYWNRLMKKK